MTFALIVHELYSVILINAVTGCLLSFAEWHNFPPSPTSYCTQLYTACSSYGPCIPSSFPCTPWRASWTCRPPRPPRPPRASWTWKTPWAYKSRWTQMLWSLWSHGNSRKAWSTRPLFPSVPGRCENSSDNPPHLSLPFRSSPTCARPRAPHITHVGGFTSAENSMISRYIVHVP